MQTNQKIKFEQMQVVDGWHSQPAHLDQRFMHVKRNGRCFVVYIRYDRHVHHWGASIVETHDDEHWNMHAYPFEWYKLNIGSIMGANAVERAQTEAAAQAIRFTYEVIHEGRITSEQ